MLEPIFTSDLHLGHTNSIYHCNRPFKNSDIMDRELIKNYNEIVTPDHDVYIVGDVSIKRKIHSGYYMSVVSQLKGKKHLILGNHDTLNPFTYINISGFWSVHTSLEITYDGIDMVLCHDPALSEMDRSKVFICGHVHNLFKTLKNVINVGVDVWDYKPVTWSQLKSLIQTLELEKNEKLW